MIWAGLLGVTLSFERFFDPVQFRPELSAGMRKLVMALQSLAVLIFVLPVLYDCLFGPGMRVSRGFLMRHSRTHSETPDFPTIFVAVAVPLSLAVILPHLAARWSGGTGKPLES